MYRPRSAVLQRTQPQSRLGPVPSTESFNQGRLDVFTYRTHIFHNGCNQPQRQCAAALLAGLLGSIGPSPATAQHLSGPANLVYAPGGELFVANFNSKTIAAFHTDGTYIGSFSTGSYGPWRIAIDNQQHLYVDSNNDVIDYDTYGNQLSTIRNAFGNGLAPTPNLELIAIANNPAEIFSRNGKLRQSYTSDVQGLMFAGGSFAIANHTLYYVSGPSSGPSIAAEYQLGEFVRGNPNETTAFTNKGAYNPTQIVADAERNIYVVGYANIHGKGDDTMVKMDRHGQVLLRISNLAFAYGVALDPIGNIYISEQNANDIKVFNCAGTLINTIQ